MYRKTFAEKPPVQPATAENRAESLGFSEKGFHLWLAP